MNTLTQARANLIKPMHDWILVELEPLKMFYRELYLPQGTTVRFATVIKTGPGRENKQGVRTPPDVRPGERICFFRWNQEHGQGKALQKVLDVIDENLGLGLVREPDILFALPDGEDLEVSA